MQTISRSHDHRDFTFVDLFCGIGSFHHSLAALGGTCAWACDNNPVVCATYATNYPNTPITCKDIEKITDDEIPRFDVLCAGFPCQPFSVIGESAGFEDPMGRGRLFSHIVRILKAKRPRAFILENVPGLLTHDRGRTFRTIAEALQRDCGYSIDYMVLKSSDHGIPQARKRLFILGSLDGLLRFPPIIGGSSSSNHNGSGIVLSDFLRLKERYGIELTERKIAYTIRCGGRRSGIGNKHNWDTYAARHIDTGINTLYTLNVEDMKTLQGFPRSFKLLGSTRDQERMLGNTIPTNLTTIVGHILVDYLERA